MFIHWKFDCFVGDLCNNAFNRDGFPRNLIIPTYVVSPRVIQAMSVEVIASLETTYSIETRKGRYNEINGFVNSLDTANAIKNKGVIKPTPELTFVDCYNNPIDLTRFKKSG